jgi:hypothetical protein
LPARRSDLGPRRGSGTAAASGPDAPPGIRALRAVGRRSPAAARGVGRFPSMRRSTFDGLRRRAKRSQSGSDVFRPAGGRPGGSFSAFSSRWVEIVRSGVAAGIEPVTTGHRNVVMARDFRSFTLLVNDLRGRVECSGVLASALECSPVMETFWRRGGIQPEDYRDIRPSWTPVSGTGLGKSSRFRRSCCVQKSGKAIATAESRLRGSRRSSSSMSGPAPTR